MRIRTFSALYVGIFGLVAALCSSMLSGPDHQTLPILMAFIGTTALSWAVVYGTFKAP